MNRAAAPRVAARVVSLRVAWWLWPHLLSFDAPLVAVVWQRWWARSAGVRLTWGQEVVLASGVWLIYVTDRLADTASAARRDHETARHAFYQRERLRMRPLAAVVFLALACLAPLLLPARQFVGGLGILTLAGGYFWLIHHLTCGGWARLLPKEAVVAGMFAVGTAFFVVSQTGPPGPPLIEAIILFGGLCFFNCALITKWERNAPDVDDDCSLLNAFPRLTAHLGVGCLFLAFLVAIATMRTFGREPFLPVALSALLLAALDRHNGRFSSDALRVLADAVLLTPWLCWGLPHLAPIHL